MSKAFLTSEDTYPGFAAKSIDVIVTSLSPLAKSGITEAVLSPTPTSEFALADACSIYSPAELADTSVPGDSSESGYY
jgi:hypothetical protein